jgi:hypothetical protein
MGEKDFGRKVLDRVRRKDNKKSQQDMVNPQKDNPTPNPTIRLLNPFISLRNSA